MNEVVKQQLSSIHAAMLRKQNAARIVFGEIESAFGKDSEDFNQQIINSAGQVRDKALTAARKEYDAEMHKGINLLICKNTIKPTSL